MSVLDTMRQKIGAMPRWLVAAGVGVLLLVGGLSVCLFAGHLQNRPTAERVRAEIARNDFEMARHELSFLRSEEPDHPELDALATEIAKAEWQHQRSSIEKASEVGSVAKARHIRAAWDRLEGERDAEARALLVDYYESRGRSCADDTRPGNCRLDAAKAIALLDASRAGEVDAVVAEALDTIAAKFRAAGPVRAHRLLVDAISLVERHHAGISIPPERRGRVRALQVAERAMLTGRTIIGEELETAGYFLGLDGSTTIDRVNFRLHTVVQKRDDLAIYLVEGNAGSKLEGRVAQVVVMPSPYTKRLERDALAEAFARHTAVAFPLERLELSANPKAHRAWRCSDKAMPDCKDMASVDETYASWMQDGLLAGVVWWKGQPRLAHVGAEKLPTGRAGIALEIEEHHHAEMRDKHYRTPAATTSSRATLVPVVFPKLETKPTYKARSVRSGSYSSSSSRSGYGSGGYSFGK